jgi:pimeloyl-ACP methyl ester carboxylesterase
MQGNYVEAGGYRTHYFDQGRGPVVVLLHGAALAVDAYLTWHATIDGLSRSFRVLAFDQPGFGRSDMPRDGHPLDRLQRVAHCLAFVEALGIQRAIFVGHSAGGFLAARMAILRPDLVDKLAIVTSGATAPRLGGDLDRAWMEASKAAYSYAEGCDSEEGFIHTSAKLSLSVDSRLEQLWRESYRRARAAGQVEMWRRLPPQARDPASYVRLQEETIHPHLGRLRMPVLLIWAARDATVPVERALALMELIPHADLHVFGAAAHMVMHDRMADFNRLLEGWCAGVG